jgi:hypothetical protein
MNDRFCEEVEHVFDKFPKSHMKLLLGDFYAKEGREEYSNQQWRMRFYNKLE